MRRWFAAVVSLTLGLAAGNGCGEEWNFDGVIGDCLDTKDPFYDSPSCRISRCEIDASAVTETDPAYNEPACISRRCALDASAEGCDAGAPSARCSGTCVSNAPNDFAAPQLVYVGEPKSKYTFNCPSNAGAFGDRQYRDLSVPNPGCPACICGPIEGSCNPRPNTIVVRSGTCDALQPGTTNFSAPENWDGSCTNVNAVPAGLECPPGSGIPCAQSVYSSTLLDPTEGCEPIPMPVPKLTNDFPKWSTMVLSCNATPLFESCEEAVSQRCLPPLPTDESGWRYCVRHLDPAGGVHACPSPLDSDFSEQVIAYGDYVDTRMCTECGCKASGGMCYGILRVYKDDNCSTNELVAAGLSSENIMCSNLSVPGEAIGSKEMTDLTYMPGKCEPTGGFTVGSAYPDESTAVTWCCMPAPNVADAGVDASVE